MNRKNTRRGFTLIELLVVVIIIAILAAIALPQYQKAVEKSRAAEAWTTLKAIEDAQKIKNMEEGTNNRYYALGELPIAFTDKNGSTVTGGNFHSQNFEYFYSGYGAAAYREIGENHIAQLYISPISGKRVCSPLRSEGTAYCKNIVGSTPGGEDDCISGSSCFVE